MVLSESARVTSAAEARFRVDAPNSLPRAVKVIALDPPAESTVKRLAGRDWGRASFLTASAFAGMTPGQSFSAQGWLSDLAGRAKDLADEIDSADLVVMVASAGETAQAVSLIGETCSLKHVMTTGLVLSRPGEPDEALSQTLAQLRPWSVMLVTASDEDYISDMLIALRA